MLNINQETMQAYQEKAKAQVKKLKAQMQIIEAGIQNANADMRIQYQKNLADWKSRFEDIEMKLNNMSESAGDAWQEVRSGVDNAMSELQESLQNALGKLKK
jgi:uncharacterized phage infection (PIP) family protein YhgE